MADKVQVNTEELIHQLDIDAVNSQTSGEQREVVYCTISTYRQPDTLSVGDVAPPLHLARLSDGKRISLSPSDGTPFVLFFGSYT